MRHSVTEFVDFNDHALARRWANRKVPISDVCEAYLDGRIDIPDDKWDGLWEHRYETCDFTLTSSHWKWALSNFLPEVAIHSLGQDKRIVSEHYDRGNDFFEWFLGEAMVYTSAYYERADMTLEEAQYLKIDRCCDKLQLKPEDKLLDIGCGWGTFVARAAREYGASTHGVTLSKEQYDFGTERIKQYGVEGRARVEVCDYRETQGTFDKIVSLEMVEHVGIKNIHVYFQKVNELLKDDGLFCLQWTGIRNLYNPQDPTTALRMRPEDLIWSLFMARYIFPGADASLTLSKMLEVAELNGFEVVAVENMSPSYVITLHEWRQLWLHNAEAVREKYGERWFRLWNFFLQWVELIGQQGSGFNYQVLMHKNHDSFNREKRYFDAGTWTTR